MATPQSTGPAQPVTLPADATLGLSGASQASLDSIVTLLTTLAGTVASGSLKAILQAGTALIGKIDVNAPSAPAAGQKTVAAAGTPEALGSGALTQGVTVRVLTLNTKGVEVRSASGTAGYELGLGESVFLPCTNLNQWLIKVQVNGEGVSYASG